MDRQVFDGKKFTIDVLASEAEILIKFIDANSCELHEDPAILALKRQLVICHNNHKAEIERRRKSKSGQGKLRMKAFWAKRNKVFSVYQQNRSSYQSQKETCQAIAKQFDLHPMAIESLVKRRRWELQKREDEKRLRDRKIKRLIGRGKSHAFIAEKMNISTKTVQRVVSDSQTTWKG